MRLLPLALELLLFLNDSGHECGLNRSAEGVDTAIFHIGYVIVLHKSIPNAWIGSKEPRNGSVNMRKRYDEMATIRLNTIATRNQAEL